MSSTLCLLLRWRRGGRKGGGGRFVSINFTLCCKHTSTVPKPNTKLQTKSRAKDDGRGIGCGVKGQPVIPHQHPQMVLRTSTGGAEGSTPKMKGSLFLSMNTNHWCARTQTHTRMHTQSKASNLCRFLTKHRRKKNPFMDTEISRSWGRRRWCWFGRAVSSCGFSFLTGLQSQIQAQPPPPRPLQVVLVWIQVHWTEPELHPSLGGIQGLFRSGAPLEKGRKTFLRTLFDGLFLSGTWEALTVSQSLRGWQLVWSPLVVVGVGFTSTFK